MTEKGKKVFTSVRLRDLCANARQMGLKVSFLINEEGKYVVMYKNIPTVAPTCLGACCFVMGMMTMVGSPVSSASKDPVEIRAAIEDNAEVVGSLVAQLFDRQLHFQQDHHLFRVCRTWIGKGRILSGKYLKQARAALLNRYMDKVALM